MSGVDVDACTCESNVENCRLHGLDRALRHVGRPGVGMPALLYLDRFGEVVDDYFGSVPYLVGSAAVDKHGWRDVDVRLILDDEEYAEFVGDPTVPYGQSRKWRALAMAFSALGRHMTGLPIDFQVQRQVLANAQFEGPRHALMVVSAPDGGASREV